MEEPENPARLAKLFLANEFRLTTHPGERTLVRHQGEYLQWHAGAYQPHAEDWFKGRLNFLITSDFERLNLVEVRAWEAAGKVDKNGEPCPPPATRRVSTQLVGCVNQALSGRVAVHDSQSLPLWLAGADKEHPAGELLSTAGGIVHVPSAATGKENAVRRRRGSSRGPASPSRTAPGRLAPNAGCASCTNCGRTTPVRLT